MQDKPTNGYGSDEKPVVMTGKNAKFKINGKTVAVAQAVEYVKEETRKALDGYIFEVGNFDPSVYKTKGTMEIIRTEPIEFIGVSVEVPAEHKPYPEDGKPEVTK